MRRQSIRRIALQQAGCCLLQRPVWTFSGAQEPRRGPTRPGVFQN